MKFIFNILFLLLIVLQSSYAQTLKGFDLSNSRIPVSEIKDGGPPRDGIPSIDEPVFLKASQASLKNDDRILGVYENGIAKAYPINILNFHEIVNDHFGDDPVVVTYCPLCGSGIAFDARIKGEPKTFGVSGMLYNSDVLLYDRETESLWSQLKYEAIAGALAGEELQILNTANTTWKAWKEKHPNSLVLSEKTGFNRDYSLDPYPGYGRSSKLYFSVSDQDERFHPKEMVIGLQLNGKTKAYPFSELEKSGKKEIQDKFQGKSLRIVYNANSKSAEIFDDIGNPIPAVTNFWFAWFAFNPDTEIYKPKQ
ncbi:MAG: DUF3179 domain-containing protein [Anditalea sp.]